ncbi:MAG: outer membrane protein transport protein [Gammaproteobacteria bacterium]|nr:outer membrane protein transport protein [Gammaproteobacteria bacterium]
MAVTYVGMRQITALILLLCSCAQAGATGFFIESQTPRTLGAATASAITGGTGESASADASMAFWNPAALRNVGGNEIVTTLMLLLPDKALERNSSAIATAGTLGNFVPTGGDADGPRNATEAVAGLYATWHTGEHWHFGVAVNSPFGLASKYDQGWPGRYDSTVSRLITVDVAPSVSYDFDQFSIGGGINIQYAKATLSSALPDPFLSTPGAAADGHFELQGDDTSIGFNLGAVWAPSTNLQLGIHYRSAMKHRLDGQRTIRDLNGPLAAANGVATGAVNFNLPEILSLGVSYSSGPMTMSARWSGFNWSRLDELQVDYESGLPADHFRFDYRDAYSAAIGLEYHPQRFPWLRPRVGIGYATSMRRAPTIDSSLPDADHYFVGGGFSLDLNSGLTADIGWIHVEYNAARIHRTVVPYSANPLLASVHSDLEFDTSADILAVGVAWHF